MEVEVRLACEDQPHAVQSWATAQCTLTQHGDGGTNAIMTTPGEVRCSGTHQTHSRRAHCSPWFGGLTSPASLKVIEALLASPK